MTSRSIDDGRQGFTLLETLIVMAISALILAVVLAAKPRAASFRLSVEARAIMAVLQSRHIAALTGAVETSFTLDPVTRTFDGLENTETLPSDMQVETLTAGGRSGAGPGEIRFYPDGRSSGGAIALSLDGAKARIDVDWLTGEPWLR